MQVNWCKRVDQTHSVRRLKGQSCLRPSWIPLSSVASRCSHLLGAVGAVDLLRFDDEALVGQRQGALLTVEAVLVPAVALVVHHVGALAEPCRRVGYQRLHTHVKNSHFDGGPHDLKGLLEGKTWF